MAGKTTLPFNVAITMLSLLPLPLPLHARGPLDGAIIDSNRDGKISGDEFLRAESRRFDLADTNRDNRLSRKEAASLMSLSPPNGRMSGGPRPKNLKSPDRDGDGYLTRMELQDLALHQFRRMDRNRDGVLTSTELPPLPR